MYTVYILYSEKFNKTYTGFTSDHEERFKSHNELGTKGWTKNFRPWKTIYTEEHLNKSDAMAREKYFKSGVGREFVKTLLRNNKDWN
jgi:putative endonuclease